MPNVESAQTDLFNGSATASYALDLPPGRNGLAPRLALAYSSSSVEMMDPTRQAAFIGAGWSFTTNYIARDTRSTYDSADDVFTLVLNGAGYDLVRDASDATLYHTASKQYWRIIADPMNPLDPLDERWRIITEDGMQYQFGYSTNSRALQWRVATRPDGGFAWANQEIYAWHLEKAIDTHANEITYTYLHDVGTVFCGDVNRTYDDALYPQTIRYNGNLTEITLSYSARYDLQGSGATKTQCAAPVSRSKLDRVDVKTTVSGALQLVRRYDFAYDYSTFPGVYYWATGQYGRLTLRSITQKGYDGTTALPAFTLTYQNNRLQRVENGIGGKVSFAYDSGVTFRDSHAVRGAGGWDFRGCAVPNGLGCSTDWESGTASVQMGTWGEDSSAMYITSNGGYAILRASQFVPGAEYRLHANIYDGSSGARVKLTAHDGVSEILIQDWTYAGSGGYFKISPQATQLKIRVYVMQTDDPSQFGTIALPLAWLDLDPTYYRVASRAVDDGNGTVGTSTYAYTNPTLNYPWLSTLSRHAPGTAFWGHDKVTVTDPTGAKTENYFHQNDLYLGRVWNTLHLDASSNKYAQTVHTWVNRPISVTQVAGGDQSNFVAITQTLRYTYDGLTSYKRNKTVYTYDAYGNVSNIEEYGDGASVYRRTEHTYYPNTSAWIVNQLGVERILENGVTVIGRTRYFYDNNTDFQIPATKGELWRVDVWKDSATSFTAATHTYDTYGNRLTTSDALGRIARMEYDATYRIFPTVITNTLGFRTTTTYDYRLGKLATTTDPNNATTSYTYDVFGRTLSIKAPLEQSSTNATVLYDYTLGNPRSMVRVQVRNDLGGTNPATYQSAWWFYDGLGRTIQQQTQSATSGQTILANTAYTARGEMLRASNPYTLTVTGGAYQTPDWNKPSTARRYDAIGRTLTITNTDTTTQNFAYNQWETTFTDANNHQRKTIADAYGRTTQVQEFNLGSTYTTNYAYDRLNRLTQVTDHAGNVTTMTYDWLGRKLAMNDPDMGGWDYRYDNAGNLIKQRDARNQAICFYYDAGNRVVGKTYHGSITNLDTLTCSGAYAVAYYYDAGANGKGRRTSMINWYGSSSWTYDAQGRALSQTDNITGAPAYTTQWTYDAMSRVRTMTYPDGEQVATTYNAQGLPAKLGNNSPTFDNYISNTNYNQLGQLTSVDFGNTVRTTYTYHAQNARLMSLVTGNGTLQNLGYTYDNVGNVKTITSTVNSQAQVSAFTYDDLDRLKTAGIAGVYSQEWDYTAIGNINWRKDNSVTTSYAYNPTTRPHAVTQVGTTAYTYDPNGNMTARGSDALTYDYENRLTKITTGGGITTQYDYNADGARVRKTEPSIAFSDGFDSANPAAWTSSGTQVVPFNDGGQNVLKRVGTGVDYTSWIFRNATLANGQSISIDFKVDAPDTRLHLALDSSDGGVYSRWALLAMNGVLYAQYTDAANQWHYVIVLNPIKLNAWYRVTLRVDDSAGFKLDVRERDGGTSGASYSYPMAAGKRWKFVSWIYQNTAYLDNYVERGTATTTTYYVGNWYEVTSGIATKYYYFGSQRVAMKVGATVTYLHGDHLGSTSVASNGTTGALVSRQTYYAFGAVRTTEGTLPTDYTFTGQKNDASSALMFYNARYYDTAIGRFTQADTIVPNLYNPQSLNRYAYVLNNPVKYTDPTGNRPCGDAGEESCEEPATLDICAVTPACIYEGDPYDVQGNHIQLFIAWFDAHPEYHPLLDPLLQTGYSGAGTIEAHYQLWFLEQLAKGIGTQVVVSGGDGVVLLAGVTIGGSFSIIDWRGYPSNLPRPPGPFNVLTGQIYKDALKAKNNANNAMHKSDPDLKGKQLHEIHPVKLGGSATDPANKIPLSLRDHIPVTVWWNKFLNKLTTGQ
ncbi:MAG: hypothetical protein HZC40_26115 [Chloroflexi bacterium]|nr:hypothetical protein [Chloroflexota bacterium]